MKGHHKYNVNSVAVIGGGSAGIAAAKYLAAEDKFPHIKVFEQRGTAGGMWNYTAPCHPEWAVPTGSEPGGEEEFPTPVYDELESNIPKEQMRFSDLPFPEDTQLLAPHQSVLEYLRQYAKDAEHLVAFRTQVLQVSPHGASKWTVLTRHLDSHQTSSEVFDAVLVANGHFEAPFVPKVAGGAAWKEQHPGSLLHSMSFRSAAPFRGKKVVVVGTGASGSEIAAQLQGVCKQPLIVSTRSYTPDVSNPPGRLIVPAIVKLSPESRAVHFANGHVEKDVDHILFCTGYLCDYPFLHWAPPLYDGFCTRNLYQNIFYIPRPTLAFVAMPLKSVPFPLSESQSSVVARVWSDRLALPGRQAMEQWDAAFLLRYGNLKMSALESAHFNIALMEELHGWALQAARRRNLGNGGHGKLPPRWGERDIWIRERLGPIKAAFTAKGEARHQIRTLEELGFDFAEWKRGATSGDTTTRLL